MRKKIIYILISISVLIILFYAAIQYYIGSDYLQESSTIINDVSSTEENGFEHLNGMKRLVEGNTYGYYIGIAHDGQNESDMIIKMENESDPLHMIIESAGIKRKIAVQFFVDYIQIPVLIDGKEEFTYFIDADECFSKESNVQLITDLDKSLNHKFSILMTLYADKNVSKDYKLDIPSNSDMTGFDYILQFSDNEEMYKPECNYENNTVVYQDMWHGLLINDSIAERKRIIPPFEMKAQCGERIPLQYHVGGYENVEDCLIVVSVQMEQTEINKDKYILCKTGDNNITSGICYLNAPQEPGLYEIIGFVVKNPFSYMEPEVFPLDCSMRFTLHVE